MLKVLTIIHVSDATITHKVLHSFLYQSYCQTHVAPTWNWGIIVILLFIFFSCKCGTVQTGNMKKPQSQSHMAPKQATASPAMHSNKANQTHLLSYWYEKFHLIRLDIGIFPVVVSFHIRGLTHASLKSSVLNYFSVRRGTWSLSACHNASRKSNKSAYWS